MIRIRCIVDPPAAAITLELDGRTLSRAVDLAAVPEASRERVLALAMAELVAVALTPDRPSAPIASIEIEPTAVDPVAPRNLEVLARASALGDGRVLGVGAAYTFRAPPLALQIDAHYDHGSHESVLGRVAIDQAGGGVRLGADVRLGPLQFGPALGLRIGVLRLSGVPASGDIHATHLTGPTGGPFASLGAALAVGDAYVRAGAEIGYLALGLRARVDDRSERVIEIGGPWMTAVVGAGFGW